jgi:quinol monooxygenase YgiN
MMSGPVTLTAQFTARPADVGRVERLMRDLAGQVRSEPGNREFSVYRDRDHLRRFVVLEKYADPNAFREHLRANHGAALNAALEPLIEETSSQRTFLSALDLDRRW